MAEDTLLHTTTSLCGTCKRSLPAELHRRGDTVVMTKACAQHGPSEVVVSSNADWYTRVMSFPPVLQSPEPLKDVAQGCPYDCGPCTRHEQRVQLPIVPITSACNLDCPICYTHNKNAGAWHMSEAELRALLEHLRRVAPDSRIINLTGGEPTQHPDFERLVELCHAEGIHRVTISTHGMRFLKDEALLEKLARLDARVILSFDSFDNPTNRDMLGGDFAAPKLRVLSLLEKHGVNTTLLPVLARGVNDHEVGRFIDLALEKDFIRSVELHTLTFTGQSGASYKRSARYGTYDVLADIERHTQGRLRIDDFVPSPAAHPLCYLVTYVLRLGPGRWLPFPRFMTWEDLRGLFGGTLYLEPGPELEAKLQDLITRLWTGEQPCDERDDVLAALKQLTEDVFAPGLTEAQRLRRAESATKALYVHAHMDEETFDTDRIRACPVGVREPDGTNVPSCAYNVLYRERDSRFMRLPRPPLSTLGPGRK